MQSTNKYKIKDPKDYKGSQVLINSDRLVFNAKHDSILMYSNESIGFSASGGIYFDTSSKTNKKNPSKFVINSPLIYLGLMDGEDNAKLANERIVLGHELRKWLNESLNMIEDLIDKLYSNYSVALGDGQSSSSDDNNIQWMDNFKEDSIQKLRDRLAIDKEDKITLVDPDKCAFLSKKVFTVK